MKGNECGYNKRFCSHIGNQIFDWSIFSIVHVRPMVKMKKGFLSIFWTGGSLLFVRLKKMGFTSIYQ